MKEAYTLSELMVAVAIGVILVGISLPTLYSGYKDSLFHDFVSEMTGHLVLARSHARLAETAVAIDFTARSDRVYDCRAKERGKWEILSFRAQSTSYAGTIKNRLPDGELLHPTSGRPLNKALETTHKPKIFFGPDGSSSGTVVYSDNDGRTLCLVLSGTTGRFRVFTRKPGARQWKIFF